MAEASPGEPGLVLGLANAEAEAELIGHVLVDNSVLERLPPQFDAAHFSVVGHQEIWRTIGDIRRAGGKANPIKLRPFLEGSASLEELGGIKYLARLTGTVSGINDAEDLANHIADLAARRSVRDALDAARRGLADVSVPISETVASVRNIEVASAGQLEIQAYRWWAAADIPRLQWLCGRWVLRGAVTIIAAAGGLGKTSFVAGLLLGCASGKALLGKPMYEGPVSVLLWGLEDDHAQLARTIAAAAELHGLSAADCGNRLLVASALGGMGLPPQPLVTATQDDGSFRLLEGQFQAIEHEVRRLGISVLVIDPFVSSHHARENETEAMDRIVKRWSLLATNTGCAVILVHHTRKTNGDKADIDAVRGSIAGVNAARIVLLLNRMTEDEAAAFSLSDQDRRRIFSVDLGKANRSVPEAIQWFRLESVSLGNGQGGPDDEIGAVMCWHPPEAGSGLTLLQLEMVRTAISNGKHRESSQSPQWAGHVVGQALGIDSKGGAGKARIRLLIREWVRGGQLRVVQHYDERARKNFEFVELGTKPWFSDDDEQ